MNRLRIKHVTGFAYQGEVSTSHNEARMLPASGDSQLVLYSNIDIRPVSSSHDYVDYWGTRVNAFEVLSPHDELSLTATSLVEVRERVHEEHDITWEELAAWATVAMEYEEQQRQTAKTEPAQEVVELVREIVSSSAGPCEAALAICRAVGERVEYVQGVTSVQTTATEAWAKRKGVCQDIAHIALGALRSAGIPARYVSGYLHPKPDATIGETVTGESHAWVEWFCGQWRGYDPTNLIDIGGRHVAVGRGRDYNDVAPLRGVYAGSSGSRLFVTVEITREA